MVNRNGRSDTVSLRIDHGDSTGLRVDNVNFVANRVRRQFGWIDANLEGSVLAKVDEVEHRDGIRASVADIGELAVTLWNIRKAAAMAARNGEK